MIEYMNYNHIFNFAKTIKDEPSNKLTTSKLLAHNDKMSTNYILKSKLQKYSCHWICNVDVKIIN